MLTRLGQGSRPSHEAQPGPGPRRAALLLAGLLALILVRTVHAHAEFWRAEPPPDQTLQAAPEKLQLWFTELLEPGFSDVQVLDANRQRVDRGDSRIDPHDATSMTVSLPPLDKGVYTVAWKALSAVDGHVTRGVYSLLIGVEAPPPMSRPRSSKPPLKHPSKPPSDGCSI